MLSFHRIIPVLLAALVLLPSAAAAPQTWTLATDTDDAGNRVMFKDASGTEGNVPISEPTRWIADEASVKAVNFGTGTWSSTIKYNDATPATTITVEVGHWDGETFNSAGMDTATTTLNANGQFTFTITPSENFVIPQGEFLMLQVSGSQAFTLVADGISDLESPESDPGYPAWELASVALLGAGLVGVLGVTRWRRGRA